MERAFFTVRRIISRQDFLVICQTFPAELVKTLRTYRANTITLADVPHSRSEVASLTITEASSSQLDAATVDGMRITPRKFMPAAETWDI